MKSLAPLANHVQNQFASSAHPLGKELQHQENRENAAKERNVSLLDKEVPDSHRLFRSSQVVHAELSYKVCCHLNTPVAKTPPQFSSAKFDADAIAENVMGFVELHVRKAAEEGASEDEIAEMLDQAREGVSKGIAEAEDILTNMGMLTEEVSSGIDQAQTAINEGIDDLEEEFIDSTESQGTPSVVYHESHHSMESIVAESFASRKPMNIDIPSIKSAQSYSQYQSYQLSNQFDLQITTQDGDVITLNAGYDYGKEEQYSAHRNRDGHEASYRSYEFESYNMSYSVEGDLDEGELAALDKFFDKVGELADTFYSGDMQAAFDLALSLDYDKSELASFALNLSHQETYQMAEAYQKVADIPQGRRVQPQPAADPRASILEQLKPLQDYVQRLLDSMEELMEDEEELPLTKQFPDTLVKAIEHHPLHEVQGRSDKDYFLDQLHSHLQKLMPAFETAF